VKHNKSESPHYVPSEARTIVMEVLEKHSTEPEDLLQNKPWSSSGLK